MSVPTSKKSPYLGTALANAAIAPYPALETTSRVTEYFNGYSRWKRDLQERLSQINVPEKMHLSCRDIYCEFVWAGQARQLLYGQVNNEIVIGLVKLAIADLTTPAPARAKEHERQYRRLSCRVEQLVSQSAASHG